MDTRPSMFGGYNCTLSETEQEQAMMIFGTFYHQQGKTLTYANDDLVRDTRKLYQRDYKKLYPAILQNIEKHSSENCLGLSILLQKELHRLGLPAVLIWICRNKDGRTDLGHCFVAYQCNNKNYCADLTAVIRGCEQYRDQSFDMWCEPMEKHIASYCRSGGVFVKFGDIDFGLSLFKEFDQVREFLYYEIEPEAYKQLPFFNHECSSHEERKTYTSKIQMNLRPVEFDKIGFPNTGYDLSNCHTPPELIAAEGREFQFTPNHFIEGITEDLGEDGTIQKLPNMSNEYEQAQRKM